MAEIHVQSKKQQSIPVWVWVLVALVILGLAAYFLTRNNTATDQNTGNKNNTTSYVYPKTIKTFWV